jgi:hypothetical protein
MSAERKADRVAVPALSPETQWRLCMMMDVMAQRRAFALLPLAPCTMHGECRINWERFRRG